MERANERKIYISLLVVLCLISLLLGYAIRNQSDKEVRHIPIDESITLNAIPLIPQDNVVTSSFVGYAEAIHQVQIIPYISGYLDTIPVKSGQFVKQGDLLLTIVPDEYKARLMAAKAEVMQQEASFQYNKFYYERVQKSGQKAFSETEIENAKNNFLQSEAALKNAEASLDLAKINYGYTTITAPISGLVGNFTLSKGDYVAPNSSLLNIVQTDPIRVVFSLTDIEYLNMLQSGGLFKDSVINLRLANGTLFKNKGEFKYTNNSLTRNTNSLSVYTYFKNENNELLPNSFVTVEVSKTFKDSVFIDKKFIQMKDDGNFITLAHGNIIKTIPIKILASVENKYLVENTFQNGDLLILGDTKNLHSGTKVHFNILK